MPTTRQRILDVAERLFAQHGIDAVSIRQITKAANVNLAAINYHFGGKKGLIAAVVERRIKPLSDQQIDGLKEVQRGSGRKAPSLEAVLEAFFRPAIEHAVQHRRDGATFARMMVRCMADPNPVVGQKMAELISPVVGQLNAMLLKALPQMDQDDISWRMHLLMGGLHQSLLMMAICKGRRKQRCAQVDLQTYLSRFLAFAVAAFKARLP